MAEVRVREAREDDVEQIRDIFAAVYHDDYPFEGFSDLHWLKRSVYSDGIVMLVAEDGDDLIGTASVVFDLGAHSDLLGEFGRLAVHPDARGRGVGGTLMAARCDYVRNRLHVGLAQNRCTHPWSQQISLTHGFAPVGFLPMKYAFDTRESVALWIRHFGPALSLRRNHPRIVPEAHALASIALEGCGLPSDAIVDEDSPPYAFDGDFEAEELTARGLPALLRIERGRVRHREVFGPMRLQYGFFQLTARSASYLVARDPKTRGVAGAIGYLHDTHNDSVHVFELISRDGQVVGFLLGELMARCRSFGVQYVDIDVSAHAPRMQRSLLSQGFLPAAYLPAMVFHDVERLDVVKMVRLMRDLDLGPLRLLPQTQAVAELVIRGFTTARIVPQIAEAMRRIALFEGLTEDQAHRVAGVCAVQRLASGERAFGQADPADALWIPLDGRCIIRRDQQRLATVAPGEVLGEVAVLLGEDHTAEAVAEETTTAAVLSRADLEELSRQRPDIAMTLYRNLAAGLGRKLRGS